MYLSKLIKKIKLKESEHETLTSMINFYKNDLEKMVDDIFIEEQVKKEDVFKTTTCCNNTQSNNTQQPIIPEYDNLLNILHKNLSLKTHPDKTDNNTPDFIIIQEAYENKNLLKLIEYSNIYNLLDAKDINVNLLTLILEKELFKIKNKIKSLKTTIAYQILINDNTKCVTDMISMHKENEWFRIQNEKFKAETEKLRIERETLQKQMDSFKIL